METKPRIESKVYWFSGIMAALGVIVQNADALTPFMGAYGGVVITCMSVIYMGLREVTKKPVGKSELKKAIDETIAQDGGNDTRGKTTAE